jgi:hypothetical protein
MRLQLSGLFSVFTTNRMNFGSGLKSMSLKLPPGETDTTGRSLISQTLLPNGWQAKSMHKSYFKKPELLANLYPQYLDFIEKHFRRFLDEIGANDNFVVALKGVGSLFGSHYGYIGGLAFSSASFALLSRDKYIGWSEAARRSHLNRVVCNNRFLILPTVDVPNLASHVLSISLLRFPYDWQERYHIEPVLLETFVDPSRFAGTCYKAANFILRG